MKLDYWEIRPCTKMNSKWIKDICKIWKYKTPRRHGLYALWILSEQYFFDKANEIKNKQICRVKKTFKKMKRCPTLCVCVFLISCVWLCDPMDCSPQGSSVHGFPGKNTGVGCHFLLQEIFSTQGLNLHLLCLLHCKWVLYCWATRWEKIIANDISEEVWIAKI